MLGFVGIVLAALIWIPYYVLGVPAAKDLVADNRLLLASLAIGIPFLVGFFGMLYVNQGFFSGNISVGMLRIIMIASTQTIAVAMIAIDTKFHPLALLGSALVFGGAIIGSTALVYADA